MNSSTVLDEFIHEKNGAFGYMDRPCTVRSEHKLAKNEQKKDDNGGPII
jgi:hypothetical protein